MFQNVLDNNIDSKRKKLLRAVLALTTTCCITLQLLPPSRRSAPATTVSPSGFEAGDSICTRRPRQFGRWREDSHVQPVKDPLWSQSSKISVKPLVNTQRRVLAYDIWWWDLMGLFWPIVIWRTTASLAAYSFKHPNSLKHSKQTSNFFFQCSRYRIQPAAAMHELPITAHAQRSQVPFLRQNQKIDTGHQDFRGTKLGLSPLQTREVCGGRFPPKPQ